MGFFTRPYLEDRQFVQVSGTTLTLSGETNVEGIFKINDVEIDILTGSSSIGDILTWDGSKVILQAPNASGNEYYTGATPSNLTVGGIPAGTVLTGKTYSELFQQLLITTFYPTLNPPFIASFIENVTDIQEVGTIIPSITFTATFDRGSISPQYSAASPYRSGLPNNYNYTGAQIAGTYPSTSLTDNRVATNYKLLLGATNTWTVSVSYDAGVQPYDSAGNPYSSLLPAGTTAATPKTLTGQYIRFYGASNITPVNSAQVRALPQNSFQTANVNTFILNTGAVETTFIVALPPSRTINTAYDLDALNAPMPYVLIGTITVNDGGGSGDPHTYNLYRLTIGAPYSSNHQHQITTA
jgi:hypothetical protein